jgi:hypothetical protein
MPLNEEGFISRVSIRHSVSADSVRKGSAEGLKRSIGA